MTRTILFSSLLALGLATTAYAAAPTAKAKLSVANAQTRAEVHSEGRTAPVRSTKSVRRTTASTSSAGASTMAAGPSVDDVGDADTFGRNVVWAGLLQSGYITMSSDCTPVAGDPPPGVNDHCITINPGPVSTSFNFPDIGQINLPGKSSKNILCHWLSPIVNYSLYNGTGVPANGRITLTPYLTVVSEVLNDPSLIDPSTGAPFGGSLVTGFAASYQNAHSMAPGDRDTQRFSESRVCIAGTLSRRGLVEGYGLTDAQVTQIFKKPMTLRFGLRGSGSLVDYASITYGLRIMGD